MSKTTIFDLVLRWKIKDKVSSISTLLVVTYGVRGSGPVAGIGKKLLALIGTGITSLFVTKDIYAWLKGKADSGNSPWLKNRLEKLIIHTFSPHQDTWGYFLQAHQRMTTHGFDTSQVTIVSHWSQMWRAAKCWERVSGQWPAATRSAWEPRDPGFPVSHFLAPLFWLRILGEETGSAIWHLRIPLLAFPWELAARVFYVFKGYL